MNIQDHVKENPFSRRTENLVAQVDQIIGTMLNKFQIIVELSSIDPVVPANAAIDAVQVESNTIQLIQADRDLCKLIREIKQIWLNSIKQEAYEEDVPAFKHDLENTSRFIMQSIRKLGEQM